jgi:hypothetical protein
VKKRVEYHLLGNHLLANAKALAAAGLFSGVMRPGAGIRLA